MSLPAAPSETATGAGGRSIPQLSKPEFLALMAILFSSIAFSIDAMLPALPEIAAELTPDAPNRAALIVTSFVLGMGVGSFFTGPLSDAFGRKPVIFAGSFLFMAGAALAWAAQSLELVLAARMLQGLGAAAPRIVAVAIIRDLYSGRPMARMMSLVIIIFTLVPAIAPTIGAGINWLFGWRGIFAAFILYSAIGATWLALRQAETLPLAARRPFRPREIAAGVREIFAIRMVVIAIVVQGLCFAMLFATISTVQPVIDVTYGRGAQFHLWFALIALLSAAAPLLNALLVERLGMRAMVAMTLVGQIAVTASVAAIFWAGVLPDEAAFIVFVLWAATIFFQAGLTVGNLTAMAMEPLGHIAGLAASVVGSAATVIAVVFAVPIALLFDGTPLPLMVCNLGLATAAFALTRLLLREAPLRA